MDIAIKTLEEIGQNSSIKQFSSVEEMIKGFEIKDTLNDSLMQKFEMICVLFPEDDNPDDSGDSDDSSDGEEE